MPSTPSLKPWGPGRRAGYGALLGGVVAAGLSLLRPSAVVESLELRLVDLRTRAFVGQRAPDPRIVVCEVQDADHKRWTRSDIAPRETWPWPLFLHEYAFRALAAAGARVVVVDLLHVDRGQSADDVTLPPGVDPARPGWAQALVGEAGQATSLASVYEKVGRVVLGFQLDEVDQDYEQPRRRELALSRMPPEGTVPSDFGLRLPHAVLPVSGLIPGSTLLGFTNVATDEDGVLRRSAVAGAWGARGVLSLPLAGAWVAVDGERRIERGRVVLGDVTQRLDEGGGFFVNFRAAADHAYRTVPPGDLVQLGIWLHEDGLAPADLPPEGRERLAQLKDAIVVYGVNMAGAEDIVSSPLSGRHHGPEFQATVIDNLLHGDGRVRVSRSANTLLLFGLCALLGALGTLVRGRWLPHVPAPALLAALFALSWALFAAGDVIDLFTPALGLLLAWGGSSVLRLVTEGRRNKWLESTFGRYVSPEVVEALKKDPTLLALGGRRRDLTVLFSDIAGFTRLSEDQPAEQVVRLLNRYLTTQSHEVMRTGGVIDKFEGDAVMAFWGDPLETPDHALRAIRSALGCLAVLPTLRPLLDELGVKDLNIRIGLNSGPALVGNMGSEERFDYTCMGDTVNLASRFEGANKAFASRLLVGAPTYLMAKEHVVAKRLADLAVVGRSAAVRVYEIVSLREDASPDLLTHAQAWARAHEALRRGDLEGCEAALAEAEARRPGDGPVAWLRALAARMRLGELPTPWDGGLTLSEK